MENLDVVFDEIETPEDYAKAVRKKLHDIVPLFGAESLTQEIEILTERLALYEIILEKNEIDLDSLDLDEEYRAGFEKIKRYSTEWLSLLVGHLVRRE